MTHANRLRRKQARAQRRRDRAAYDQMTASLSETIRKNEARLEDTIGRPLRIKPCPEPSWPGFGALSREALAGVAAVFRAAVVGRRDATRD